MLNTRTVIGLIAFGVGIARFKYLVPGRDTAGDVLVLGGAALATYGIVKADRKS